MTISPVFHFLSFLLLLLLFGNSCYGCIEQDRQALLTFKQTLRNSSPLTSWTGTDCCSWTGVHCDGTFVVTLSYHDYEPQQIGDVEWISNLTSLQNLTLGSVDLSGARNLFQVLTLLPCLSVLSLSYCRLNNTHISPPQTNSTNFISRIQHLDLSYNSFDGPLPSFLQNMTSLTHLDLSFNSFDGPLPSFLQNMTSLTHLDLSSDNYGYNNFRGEIPDWLMSFKNLTLLDLHYNSFSGPIPSSIQKLSNLKELDLRGNKLNGSIPTSMGQLSRLTSLDLGDNEFSGVVPESLGQLVNLERLGLYGNSLLEGLITEIHLTNLSKLTYLDIQNNQNLRIKVKSGWEPSFQLEYMYMGSCKLGTEFPQWMESQVHLYWLDVSNCSISGPIPDWLMSFQNLTFLYLGHNSFNGSIPSTLGKLSRLGWLDLSNNQLSGVVPESLGQLVHLWSLDVSFNSLQGFLTQLHLANLTQLEWFYINSNNLTVKVEPNEIPSFQPWYIRIDSCKSLTEFPRWLETQRNLLHLDLSNCSISGPIPDWVSNMNLTRLDLSHNNINGQLPQNIVYTMPYLAELRLSHNIINGTIPFTFCNLTNLQVLDLSTNLLSGDIPNCWNYWNYIQPALSTLKLSSNKLTGFIPSSLGRLSSLSSLHLNNNSLHGEIPLSLQKCTELIVLDLGDNGLNGSIPAWIGQRLLRLVILRLRDNRFVGGVPSQLCQLPSLKILDIAENNLSSTIPQCLGNLTGMILSQTFPNTYSELSLETISIVIQGRVMEYSTVLRFLVTMDLSNNDFGGMVPEDLTNLNGLHGLNLSYNHLIGNIPKNIGRMKSLASLDLSRNQLCGSIPPSLSNLYSLSHLNMSYNNLSGQIPTGSQLQALSDGPTIYLGNPELCGAPVLKKCTVDKLPSDDEDNDKDDKFDNLCFYIAVTLGYATGVWAIIGVLIFKKKWRYAYFRFVDDVKDSIYVAVVVKTRYLKRKMGFNQ